MHYLWRGSSFLHVLGQYYDSRAYFHMSHDRILRLGLIFRFLTTVIRSLMTGYMYINLQYRRYDWTLAMDTIDVWTAVGMAVGMAVATAVPTAVGTAVGTVVRKCCT